MLSNFWRRNNGQRQRRVRRVDDDTLCEIVTFLSRRQIARVEPVCRATHRLIAAYFSSKPYLIIDMLKLIFHHQHLNLCGLLWWWSYRKILKVEVIFGGCAPRNCVDVVPNSSPLFRIGVPKYVRLNELSIWISRLDELGPIKACLDHLLTRFNDVSAAFGGTTLELYCSARVFPTRRHFVAFLRSTPALQVLLRRCRAARVCGDHAPREDDRPECALLPVFERQEQVELDLQFSETHHFCNYALARQHIEPQEIDRAYDDEALSNHGAMVGVVEIADWLHSPVASAEIRRRKARIGPESLALSSTSELPTIEKLLELLKMRFIEDAKEDAQRSTTTQCSRHCQYQIELVSYDTSTLQRPAIARAQALQNPHSGEMFTQCAHQIPGCGLVTKHLIEVQRRRKQRD